jgi:hypothetical protein
LFSFACSAFAKPDAARLGSRERLLGSDRDVAIPSPAGKFPSKAEMAATAMRRRHFPALLRALLNFFLALFHRRP